MTNYSAKHWAIKAEKSAEDSKRYSESIDLSNYVNKSELENYAEKADLSLKANTDLGNTELAELKNVNGTLTWMGNSLLSSGRNIGDIFYTTRTDTELNGAVECNGATFSTSDFIGSESIGVLLSGGKVPYVSLTEYQTAIDTNGSCRAFGWDGGDSFRVPTLNDVYIEAGTALTAGEFISESLPNITGNLGGSSGLVMGGFQGQRGAINSVQTETANLWGSNKAYIGYMDFDASKSSPTYQDGAKVKPDSVRYRAMVQLANKATDEALITATSAIQQIANKVDKTSATDIAIVAGWGMPDYSAGVSKAWNTNISASRNCFVYIESSSSLNAVCCLYVDGVSVFEDLHSGSGNPRTSGLIPIKKGSIYIATGNSGQLIEYPCIGG